MTRMTDEVRETFETAAREVPVPAFDELAFRAQVRRARRRRTGRAVLATGVAAGVVSVALLAVPPLLDGDGDGDRPAPPVAGRNIALDPSGLPQPLYYVSGMQLFAATPDGEVHDLGASEGIVGSTAEGVVTTTPDSRLVWIGASTSGEGDGSFSFARNEGPVTLPETGPVQDAALSADGRWLAWLDLDDQVIVWDLKADEMLHRIQVVRNSAITSVSERGVLVSMNGNLTLLGSKFDVTVPTEADGYGVVSDVAGDLVTVVDRDDVTRIYDVSKEKAELVDSVPGTGRLSAYALAVVSVSSSADGETAEVTHYAADGEPETLGGIEGTPQTAGWLDERYALVTSAEAGGTVVYLCPVAEDDCTPVAFSETDVRLAE